MRDQCRGSALAKVLRYRLACRTVARVPVHTQQCNLPERLLIRCHHRMIQPKWQSIVNHNYLFH